MADLTKAPSQECVDAGLRRVAEKLVADGRLSRKEIVSALRDLRADALSHDWLGRPLPPRNF